jgi:hypothetical protein
MNLMKELDIFSEHPKDLNEGFMVHHLQEMILVVSKLSRQELVQLDPKLMPLSAWNESIRFPFREVRTQISVLYIKENYVKLLPFFQRHREEILKDLSCMFDSFPLSVFPKEICDYIGSFLQLQDRFRLSTVSRQFLRLFLNNSFLSSIQTFKVYEKDIRIFKGLTSCMKNLSHLCVSGLPQVKFWDFFEWWSSPAQQLVSLEIISKEEILPYNGMVECEFPSLKRLLIRGSFHNISLFANRVLVQFPELKVLWLESFPIDMERVRPLKELCPKLEDLTLRFRQEGIFTLTALSNWISGHSSLKRLCIRAAKAGIIRNRLPSHLQICYPCRCQKRYLDPL